MEIPVHDKDTRSAEDVWAVQPGEITRIRPIHLGITLLLIVVGILAGAFGSINFPLGFGVNFFWTGIAVQQVGAVWFGAWGVLAGTIFPIFSNVLSGLPLGSSTAAAATPMYVSLAYIPANFIQAFLPAWAFRRYRADPRLRSGRDFLVLLAAMLVSSAFGALWSPLVVLRGFGMLETESLPMFVWGWFGGNMVAGLVYNFVLLKALSPMVIRSKAFVKKWFA